MTHPEQRPDFRDWLEQRQDYLRGILADAPVGSRRDMAMALAEVDIILHAYDRDQVARSVTPEPGAAWDETQQRWVNQAAKMIHFAMHTEERSYKSAWECARAIAALPRPRREQGAA